MFSSGADNLVPGDTNERSDILVYDRQVHATELITLAEDGSPANESRGPPGISSDGRWVVFVSIASNLVAGDTNDLSDVFIHDRQTGLTILVSMAPNGTSGNGMSTDASISADGRWIAFQSFADNLVPNDTNGYMDVFVYSRETGIVKLVSWAVEP